MLFGAHQREKIENFWYYHSRHVLIAAIALAVLLYFAVSDRQVDGADYHVAAVCAGRLTEEAAAEISEAFAAYGTDLDGDGRVTVRVHAYRLDLAAPEMTADQNSLADYTALEADFAAAQSGIFLTDDPAAFQRMFGALAYLDGSSPLAGADDVERMTVPWKSANGLPPLWAGFRTAADAKTREKLGAALALWERFLQAQQGPAA